MTLRQVDSKLANIILNEIVESSARVDWDDVGLSLAGERCLTVTQPGWRRQSKPCASLS